MKLIFSSIVSSFVRWFIVGGIIPLLIDKIDEIASMWKLDQRFEPQQEDPSHAQWLRAVERSRSWASPES